MAILKITEIGYNKYNTGLKSSLYYILIFIFGE